MVTNCDNVAGKAPANFHQYICDTEDDLASIDTAECCAGSTAVVTTPEYKKYILGSDSTWTVVTATPAVTSTGSTSNVFSPVISVNGIENGHQVTVIDAYGSSSFAVMNGEKGDKGDQGVKGDRGETGMAPLVAVTNHDDGADVRITDIDGTKFFTLTNGEKGEKGDTGEPGEKGETGAPYVIKGSYNSALELNVYQTSGNPGDGYLVDGDLYSWIDGAWANVGNLKGPQGEKGEPGEKGEKGERGLQGPPVYVQTEDTDDGAILHFFSGNEDYRLFVKDGIDGQDGADGEDGADGFSPFIEAEEINNGYEFVVTNKNGSRRYVIKNGIDGVSPKVEVEKFEGYSTLHISDAYQSNYVEVHDGAPFTYDDFTQEQLESLKPQKGIDYFTEADKDELIEMLLARLAEMEG